MEELLIVTGYIVLKDISELEETVILDNIPLEFRFPDSK
jgi:hypothetical protein